jgi:hypothetical protein
MVSRRFCFYLFLASALLLLPTSGRACSVCQCGDPLFSPEGASSQSAGAFNFFLESRFSTKSSGTLPHGDEDEEPDPSAREYSDDRDLTLYASWTPVSKVTLTAAVPFRWIEITEKHSHDGDEVERHRSSNRGFGDAAFYLTTVLWRDLEHSPTTWLELRGMVKAPTGQSKKRIDGEEDPHLQVGTGSWDFGLGLAAGHHFEHFALYASTFYRLNTEGSLEYQYGDVFLANLVATSEALPLVDGLWLRPGVELNFRYAGHDTSDDNVYDSSGGSIGYVTPFFEVPIGRTVDEHVPWLRLAVRMPMGDGGLFGHQHESFVYTAGIGFPL